LTDERCWSMEPKETCEKMYADGWWHLLTA
jgi:hypothetical protein